MTLKTLFAAAAALMAMAAPALAAPYTIFVYETREDFALRSAQSTEAQTYWAEWMAYTDRLAADGVIRGGAPLAAPVEAVTIDARGARKGAKNQGFVGLGGYFQIEAESLEAAQAYGALSPSVRRGGRAEVRPNFAAPTMMAE